MSDDQTVPIKRKKKKRVEDSYDGGTGRQSAE